MTKPTLTAAEPWDRNASMADANSTLASCQIRKVFLNLLVQQDPEPVDFDLVRKWIKLPDEVHPNVFGAAALLCLQNGLAVPVGLVRSARPAARKSKSQQWIIADRRKVRRWLEAYADLETLPNPQMDLPFEGGQI